MSNALTRAVATVKRKIPPEILNFTFATPYQHWRNTPNSIDHEILQQVIRPRVIADCDFVGGIEDTIRLTNSGVRIERTDELFTVLYIPKTATGGKTITSALFLSYVDYRNTFDQGAVLGFNNCSVTPLNMASMALMNSFTGITAPNGTARLEIIGENVILVKDQTVIPNNGVLRCILSNDSEMNNLSVRSYVNFCELCTLAVKAHIYNFNIVKIDEGVVHSGRQIGAYRQIIEGYSDAEEMYIEFLQKKWQKISLMNDRESHLRIIRSQISAFR